MVAVKEILSLEDVKKEILEFCLQTQYRLAILEHLLVTGTTLHYAKYIGPLLAQRYLRTDFKEKRSARQEKYIITQKGLNYLKAIAFWKIPSFFPILRANHSLGNFKLYLDNTNYRK